MIEPQMDRRYFLTEGLAAGAGHFRFPRLRPPSVAALGPLTSVIRAAL